MNTEDMRIRVGKGYAVEIRDNREELGFEYYDVTFVYGGRWICNITTGCIGMKSAKYWMDHYGRVMKRVLYLCNEIDKHSENDTINMLTEWLHDELKSISSNEAILKELSKYTDK